MPIVILLYALSPVMLPYLFWNAAMYQAGAVW
jgi:hypothetical protein